MNYYKDREDNRRATYEISDIFWNSYCMYMKRMAKEHWLTESFGYKDESSGWKSFYNIDELNDRIIEELGITVNIFRDKNVEKPITCDILSLIEFFYLHISKPRTSVYGYQNEEFPSEFSSKDARYLYTVYLNDLFKKRKHCFQIKSGQITKIVSEKLNSLYYPELGKAVDNELNKMLDDSFNYFTNRNNNQMDDALTIIANALERTKTLEGDKKKSIEVILSRISDNDEIKQDISNLIKLSTKISNQYRIRHHEVNQIKIKDVRCKEFLYYNYLNIIRLLLSTYDIEL